MCTAISYRTTHHYFGRNLDLERSYGEGVLVTPRRYRLCFRHTPDCDHHPGLIGMGVVAEGYPLYFEATNEAGLSMAGLNFPGNAVYHPFDKTKKNVAPFELIPYVLCSCARVSEAEQLLQQINVVDTAFSEDLPLSPLHWLLADARRSLVLESTAQGLQLYDNPFGVLTNNPPFPYHLTNMHNYRGLHTGALSAQDYSLGMGALGLPGDFSSPSRFVRAAFVRENAVCDGSTEQSVNQFFHILGSVAMPKGCVKTPGGEYEYTRYSCCCDTEEGVYYYTTYADPAIRSVSLSDSLPDGCRLSFTPINKSAVKNDEKDGKTKPAVL